MTQVRISFDDHPENPFDAMRARSATPGDVVSWLTYQSYAHNRRLSPETTPEQWEKIFPQAKKLEEFYQREVAMEAKIKEHGPCEDSSK